MPGNLYLPDRTDPEPDKKQTENVRIHLRNLPIPSSLSRRASANVALLPRHAGRPTPRLRRRRDPLHPGRRLHDHGTPDNEDKPRGETCHGLSGQIALDEGLCAQ